MLEAFREGGTEHVLAAETVRPTVGQTSGGADDELSTMPNPRLPIIPLDDHVEALAEAMFANRETAMRYLRTIARTRLAKLDMYARGLLIGAERHRVKGTRGD